MPDSKRRNALIGLFVLGALISLGILIVKFGEAKSWFGQYYMVMAHFDRIVGVREGTEVRLAGVWVGQVKKVDLADRQLPSKGVIVAMEIGKEFLVSQGSVASVTLALMGQPVINIIPPQAPTELLPNDGTAMISGTLVNPLEQVIDPKLLATLEKTTAQIGTLAETLTPAAHDIHVLLEKRTTQQVDLVATTQVGSAPTTQEVTANLSTAIQRLDNVLKHIETVFGDPAVQGNIKTTLDNLKLASEDARAAVGGLRMFSQTAQATATQASAVVGQLGATVDLTKQHIDTLGKKLADDADRLAKFLDTMVAAGQDMAEGKGTIGMLLRDPQFYEEMLLTMKRLGMAASEMQVTIKQWQEGGLGVKLR